MKRFLILSLLGSLAATGVSGASPTRTQTIPLAEGWNAVFLEVEPVEPKPDAVFADLPVDRVARYFPVTAATQYLFDPDETPWNRPGWGVWYAPDREDAVLTNLFKVAGNCPYLVHATEDCVWTVEGAVQHHQRRWRTGAFNLAGFTVDPQSPPTFAEYFAGTGGRIGQRVYRLVNENWVRVDPERALIEPGRAYWIYCSGATGFQGPVSVRHDVTFNGLSAEASLRLESGSPTGQALKLASVGGALPIELKIEAPETLLTSYEPLPEIHAVELPAGYSTALELRLSEGAQHSDRLIKISNSQGAILWVPLNVATETQP